MLESPGNALSPVHPAARPGRAPDAAGAGAWRGSAADLIPGEAALREALHDLRRPVALVERGGEVVVARGGEIRLGADSADGESLPLLAHAPALHPRRLGDAAFLADHGIVYPYMTGAMANGIASTALVEAGARAGFLGSYGAAGQSPRQVEQAIERLAASLHGLPFCANLIHSPNEPAVEERIVDLYLARGVGLVEASAYLDLTPAVVRYRVTGLHRGSGGEVVTPNRIIAKASRVEVAARWLGPPPERLVAELLRAGRIAPEEAQLAREIPMAGDLTAEADSGGHTDNRPAITLIPTFMALRDRLAEQHGWRRPPRIGAAGGIATPASAAAAFAMGAAYVVTGSVNQACVESGSSDRVRQMLAEAEQADVTMAPAADMFEMGVKLQVLKRGTMFPMRAQKLYELYRAHASLADVAPRELEALEKTVFRASIEEVWRGTREFFLERDPSQIERAERDPKHKMALVFRTYLGFSSRWANAGEPTRQLDYQVWCGPAMGAFNEWTRGTFLAAPTARRLETVGLNILHGAAVVTRLHALRLQGARLPAAAARIEPLDLETLKERLR